MGMMEKIDTASADRIAERAARAALKEARREALAFFVCNCVPSRAQMYEAQRKAGEPLDFRFDGVRTMATRRPKFGES